MRGGEEGRKGGNREEKRNSCSRNNCHDYLHLGAKLVLRVKYILR